MPIPKPKVPVRIIKGTNRALAVEYGDDIMIPATRVWEISDINTGCLSEAIPGVYPVDLLDGSDAGVVTVSSITVIE